MVTATAGAQKTVKIVKGATTLNLQVRNFDFEGIKPRILDARATGDNANNPFMQAGIEGTGTFEVLDQFAALKLLHGQAGATVTEIINTAGTPSNGTVWTGWIEVPLGETAPHDGLQSMKVTFHPTAIPTAYANYQF